jgi:lipid-binding SYLF domain-containing protein
VTLIPQSLRKLFSKAFSLAGKEAEALEELHAESRATVHRMAEEDPALQQMLDRAYAYAVFPSVGKATAGVGGAFGKGEVFRGGNLVGYAGLLQLTLGVQLGGQTFSEIVAFENTDAFDRFKAGRTAFAANASAVLVKAGAAASSNYTSGALVFVSSEGGMMLEAAIGAQKFFFKSAALGRTRSAPVPRGPGKPSAKRSVRAKQARRVKHPGTSARSDRKAKSPAGSRRRKARSPSRRRGAGSGS